MQDLLMCKKEKLKYLVMLITIPEKEAYTSRKSLQHK